MPCSTANNNRCVVRRAAAEPSVNRQSTGLAAHPPNRPALTAFSQQTPSRSANRRPRPGRNPHDVIHATKKKPSRISSARIRLIHTKRQRRPRVNVRWPIDDCDKILVFAGLELGYSGRRTNQRRTDVELIYGPLPCRRSIRTGIVRSGSRRRVRSRRGRRAPPAPATWCCSSFASGTGAGKGFWIRHWRSRAGRIRPRRTPQRRNRLSMRAAPRSERTDSHRTHLTTSLR